MEYDEIVIGSGLSALATVIGLPPNRRVLVLGAPDTARTLYYEATGAVPCAYPGYGGLGNFWHGVIPTGERGRFAHGTAADFESLFQRFYPGMEVAARIGKPFLFVPWKPIRPQAEWARLARERGERLKILRQLALRFELTGDGVAVHTGTDRLRAGRLWVCGGALQTPGLLGRSLDRAVARDTVSDHVLCYIGQIDRALHPGVSAASVERTRAGVWFGARYNESGTALVTLRPARFQFRRLDSGIEQRAVFGLPTGSAVAKIMRRASAGLLAEALYNRAGLFPNSRFQSVYAQLLVPDAHRLRAGDAPVVMRQDVIRAAVDAVRANVAWPEIQPSRRLEIFIPMIHLHHSVDLELLRAAGLNDSQSAVRVVDASVCEHIGPEHHSFRMMVAAFAQARAAR